MDPVTWIVIGGVIVLAAVAVGLWNKFGSRSSQIDQLDHDGAKSVRDAQANVERERGMGGGMGV